MSAPHELDKSQPCNGPAYPKLPAERSEVLSAREELPTNRSNVELTAAARDHEDDTVPDRSPREEVRPLAVPQAHDSSATARRHSDTYDDPTLIQNPWV